MAGKYFDLDLDKNLGGENASDITVASQKAVKDYVDKKVGAIVDKDTDKLKDLKDVKLTNIEDNQSLVYDKTTETWVNKNVVSSWGNISGTLESQTDLKEALDNKANKTDLPTKVSQLDNDAGYLTTHQDISGKADKDTLAKVATSGEYKDLKNTPTIPTVSNTYSAISTDAMSGKAVAEAISTKANDADLSTVAKSGSYNDLSNKPTIPIVPANIVQEIKAGKTANIITVNTNGTNKDITIDNVANAKQATKDANGNIITSTYATKDEVSAIPKFAIQVVEALPSENISSTTVYLLNTGDEPDNIYTEYIYVNQRWEKLGTQKLDLSGYAQKTDLATVATSGSYNDLTDTPTIPIITDVYSAVSSLGMSGKAVANAISVKTDDDTLAKVAKSGSFADLTDKPVIDLELKADSINAVQNKVVKASLDTKAEKEHIHTANEVTGLETVATSGSYNDLKNKPTIPTTTDTPVANSNEALTAGGAYSALLGKANTTDLATVATSGSYNDLTNKPIIDDALNTLSDNAVKNSVITNKFNTKADTATTYTKKEVEALIPTKTSDLTNDSNFLTAIPAEYITETELNAKGYLTAHQDISGKADKSETLAGYGIKDAYTKTEIDGKLTAAMHFKGTVDNVSLLPESAETGDMYNVKSTGANYAWDGTAWDKLSENIDLSNFYTKEDVNRLIPDTSNYDTHIADKNIHVTKDEKAVWNGKQASISDLENIRSGAAKGATAIQPNDNISSLNNDAGYLTNADISAAMIYKGSVATYTDLPKSNKTGDVYNVKENGANYAWDGTDWDYLGATIDLSGYQTKITTDNKLSADLISNGTTNTVVTNTEKTTWSNKQDAITDLETIRNNASAGKTASDTIAKYGDVVSHNASEFAEAKHNHTIAEVTNLQTNLDTKQSKITSTAKLSADLLSEGTTNKLVSASEKATWGAKQDAISDLETIRTNAKAGANTSSTIANYGDIVSHNFAEVAEAEHTHKVADITDLAIPTVNDSTITIQKNGTAVDTFTTNQAKAKSINITVPTTAADVNALADSTKYANDLSFTMNTTTFVITAVLKDQDGTALATQTIDLPMETVVVGGSYDKTAKKIVLSLQNGETVDVPVADLVSGLQNEITSTNKLSADLIADGTTNKVVTATEKTTWSGKQDKISDLATIRTNASSGKAAADTIASYGDVVTHNIEDFANATHNHTIANVTDLQTTLDGKQASITTKAKLSADLVADGTTNKTVTATEKTTWNNKQNAISDLSDIRSGATAGATAVQPGDLAKVATSNSYADLDNKPTIPTVTDTYSATSTNAMSGKAVASAISGKMDKVTLGKVATSNSYNDLDNKPTIPSAVTETTVSGWGFTKNAGTVTQVKVNGTAKTPTNGIVDLGAVITAHQDISGKANTADLAKVATSGSYADLSNKPTIPAAVTTETVAGWGYTKNVGTVTQVKVNGTAKSPTNGVVDLGTVLTAHQSLASYIKGLSVSGKTITYTKGDNTTDTITTQDTTYSAGTGITISGGKISLAAHNQASNTITALTGYKKATAASAIATTDSLNTALGKLEYKCENATVSKITVGMLAN